MIFTAENILLIGSILLFVSIVVGKTGYRFGVPALLLFLLVGMLFGSDGLGLQFHNAKIAQFIGMVALSVILFSGGMDTKFKEIRPILSPGIVLSTVGVFLTALFTGLFIWYLSGMSWTNIHFPLITSLLLASTMSSTDSASVFAILRSQKMNLKHNLRPMLELESGSNDPMAYMLTIVLIQFIQSDGMGTGNIIGSFIIQFLVGAAAGYILGKLAILILNKINIDNQSLYPILLLSFVFFTFAITDLLRGNGYLAVYIAGMMVGNHKITFRKEIATFMDGLTWLFQIIMFLMLGLLVNPHEMIEVAVVALLIGVLVANVEGSNMIFNIVFFITIVSLIVQGTSVSFVARLLHLSTPLEKTGNDFGVELPEEIDTDLSDMTITMEMLNEADTLKDMNLPKGTLVMIVKRGDEFLIPNGTLKLHVGDKLLLISEKNKQVTVKNE